MKRFLTIIAALLLLSAGFSAAAKPKFVDIKGSTAYGKEISLSEFAGSGNYVLVDFWASWCGPCMKAVPHVYGLQQKYSDRGLVLVGVNSWERKEGDGQECARRMEMTWPVIFADQEAVAPYGIKSIPHLMLIGPDGTILERLTGDAMLEKTLEKYFK